MAYHFATLGYFIINEMWFLFLQFHFHQMSLYFQYLTYFILKIDINWMSSIHRLLYFPKSLSLEYKIYNGENFKEVQGRKVTIKEQLCQMQFPLIFRNHLQHYWTSCILLIIIVISHILSFLCVDLVSIKSRRNCIEVFYICCFFLEKDKCWDELKG